MENLAGAYNKKYGARTIDTDTNSSDYNNSAVLITGSTDGTQVFNASLVITRFTNAANATAFTNNKTIGYELEDTNASNATIYSNTFGYSPTVYGKYTLDQKFLVQMDNIVIYGSGSQW